MNNRYLILLEKIIEKTKENNSFIWENCRNIENINNLKKYTTSGNIIRAYKTTIISTEENNYRPLDFFMIMQSLNDPFDCIYKKNAQSYPYIMIVMENNSPPLIITIDLLDFSSILQELYDLIQNKLNDLDNQLDLFTQTLESNNFYTSKEINESNDITDDNISPNTDRKSSSEYLNIDDIIFTGKPNNEN